MPVSVDSATGGGGAGQPAAPATGARGGLNASQADRGLLLLLPAALSGVLAQAQPFPMKL